MPSKQAIKNLIEIAEDADPYTKSMVEKLAALEKENRELKEINKNQEERIEKLVARGSGWLIIAANPLYDGVTYGIKFINGQAWIPMDRKIERFEIPPLKPTQLASFKKDEQEAIREREKTPSSKRAVDALVHDFGFRAIYFDGKDQDAIQSIVDERAKEAADLQAKLDADTGAANINSLFTPHRMGR